MHQIMKQSKGIEGIGYNLQKKIYILYQRNEKMHVKVTLQNKNNIYFLFMIILMKPPTNIIKFVVEPSTTSQSHSLRATRLIK